MARGQLDALVGSGSPSAVGYDRQRHGIHNLSRAEVIADPLRYVDAINELGPVFFDEVGRVWVCAGYPESALVLTDDRRFSAARLPTAATLDSRGLDSAARVMSILREQLLFVDAPQHTALRAAVREQFSISRVRSRDDHLMRIAEDALDGLPSVGSVDLVEDFAARLPTRLMTHLLGMPGRDADLIRWADAYEHLLGSLSTLPDIRDQAIIPVLDEAMVAFADQARLRLREPGDDLVTALVAGLADDPGDPGDPANNVSQVGQAKRVNQISPAALHTVAANCLVLVGGGYQTLTHLVAGGLLLLDQHRDQQRLLRDDPDFIDQAIDEFMRVNGSSQYVARQARVDVELSGCHIRQGQTVVVLLAAANLDPRQFPRPRSLDITRRATKHLGFALGRHHCVGAPYAQRLARWAILGFLARYPYYQADSSRLAHVWGQHANTRCLAHAYIVVESVFGHAGWSNLTSRPVPADEAYADEAYADEVDEDGTGEAPDHNQHRLTVEWNDTAVPLGPYSCWQQIFEDRARRTPDECTVEDQLRRYSYQEIDRRANALAHILRREGVEPETVVAVLLERSVSFVIAVLAIAKAGGAFLLADVDCPTERLHAMIEAAAVPLVLTDKVCADRLSDVVGAARVIAVECADIAEAAPITGVGAGNTAYVVFTSGTTGRPKAIANSHEGLVALHTAQRRVLAVGQNDRLLQFLSPNFDGCVFDLMLGLLSAAVLVVLPTASLTVGPPLARTLRDRRITAVLLTPSVWAALPHERFADLRLAVAVGERLPGALVDRWSAPNRRLLNLYGPAETAIWATFHECRPGAGDPPIGRPIPNKRVYVVDEALTPVAVGQEGELCVGGIGIGRYLGQPTLMEERFRLDPFVVSATSLLYRTGDRARWRSDGTLEFLGRRDRQVKIRGQRIELDEVERVLQSAPGIKDCAVAVRDGRLAATIVLTGEGFDEAAIRRYLGERMHTGGLPSTFAVVDELPRTLNGKADAGLSATVATAAPVPTAVLVPGTVATDSAENALVERVVAMFANCLGVARGEVDVRSDFFSLGGDSLAMAALLTTLEKESGQVVDVEMLLLNPTPEAMSAYLANSAVGLRRG